MGYIYIIYKHLFHTKSLDERKKERTNKSGTTQTHSKSQCEQQFLFSRYIHSHLFSCIANKFDFLLISHL